MEVGVTPIFVLKKTPCLSNISIDVKIILQATTSYKEIMQTTLNQHEFRLNSSWQVVLSGSILEVQAKGFGSGALFLSKGRKVTFSNICLQMFKALIEANQIF